MTDKVSWPAWFYGPDGASEIFNNADEVPPGWKDHPSKVDGADTDDDEDEHVHVPADYEGDEGNEGEGDEGDEPIEVALTAQDLAEAHTQDQLIELIEGANEEREEDEQIEFARNWAKVKLAQALIDAGVELTIEEE